MRTWIISLGAAMTCLPAAGSAAELPIPPLHKARHVAVHHVHRMHTTRPAAHFGYFFGGWGARMGGTAGSWHASTFALGGAPWNGTGALLASSPKGVASIDCSARRPDVCLAEPIVMPVRPVGPLAGQ